MARAHPFKSHRPCISGATQNRRKADQNFKHKGDVWQIMRGSLTFAGIENIISVGPEDKVGSAHCETARSGLPDRGSYPRRNKRLRPQMHSTRWHLYDRPIQRSLVVRQAGKRDLQDGAGN